MLSKCDLGWSCVITRWCQLHAGRSHTDLCLNWARAFISNLQVATAGEDEEDLRVVDGQQRTARRDDEHGCALNTADSALLRFKTIGSKKRGSTSISLYVNIHGVKKKTQEGPLLFPGLSLQLVEPWRAAEAPSSAVHVSEMRGCIPRPECAPPPGQIEDWVGKRDRGWGQIGDPDVRAAHFSKSETVVSLKGWETVASPGAPAPGMSPAPLIFIICMLEFLLLPSKSGDQLMWMLARTHNKIHTLQL